MKLDLNLTEIEELALSKDDKLHQLAALLVLRVRQLEHELADPNYSYGGRICRQAIVTRNVEIERLRDKIKEQNLLILQFRHEMKEQRGECTIPPIGWKCTRDPGHDGPCAAVKSN
jgi:hypothetical protein